MSARNENLRKLERVNITLVDYHRWLGHEFPEVERVLENLFIEINSRPIDGGEDVSSFRSISNLREELRRMRGDTARLNWLLPNLHPANFGLEFAGGYEWDSEAEFLRKWREAIDAALTKAAPRALDDAQAEQAKGGGFSEAWVDDVIGITPTAAPSSIAAAQPTPTEGESNG